MNLRNAALNFDQRKKLQNDYLDKQNLKKYVENISQTFIKKGANDRNQGMLSNPNNKAYKTGVGYDLRGGHLSNSLVMSSYEGSTYQKTIYEGVQDMDPYDQASNELNMKLLGVLQSLDSKKYN